MPRATQTVSSSLATAAARPWRGRLPLIVRHQPDVSIPMSDNWADPDLPDDDGADAVDNFDTQAPQRATSATRIEHQNPTASPHR